MPTFLNKIMGVFSTSAHTEASGIDFDEVSASEVTAEYATGPSSNNGFIFVATCTVEGPAYNHHSVFLTDGQPLASAKIFKVFTDKEEEIANKCAAGMLIYYI